MRDMGDKIMSKQIADKAKVNTVPGFRGVIKDEEHALRVAKEIGYPVMVKASSGGGGKGMRICRDPESVREGFRLCGQEAQSSFGDPRLLVEKYIENPRHIEIQIMGDGNYVYLNERECSVQRRNQKVIEEAPSPFSTPELREAMGKQAVALARQVGYQSAGTVEFLVDDKRNFYFLEMNTRLQVEHPVTELTTGFDLVELMLRVACGQKLPITQKDVKLNGHSMEARVYAEDPLNNFLPSIGRITHYSEPVSARVDSGYSDYDDVSIFYDPILSKVVTHGKDRETARKDLLKALDTYLIRGPRTNIPFLQSILRHPYFIAGDLTTNFIPLHYPKGFHGFELKDVSDRNLFFGAAASIFFSRLDREQSFEGSQLKGFEKNVPKKLIILVKSFDNPKPHKAIVEVDCFSSKTRGFSGKVDGQSISIQSDYTPGSGIATFTIGKDSNNSSSSILQIDKKSGSSYDITMNGSRFDVAIQTEMESKLSSFLPEIKKEKLTKCVLSPMPGCVFSLKAKVGDRVVAGEELCVIEAMKMQNVIHSERDGVIKAIRIKVGDTVQSGQTIVDFE